MFDILEVFLIDHTTPEILQDLRLALQTFDDINLEDYQASYEELLCLDDVVDSDKTLNDIIDLTKKTQHQLLLEHGVTISDEADIEQLDRFIRGIILVQDFQDKDKMLEILSADESAKEIFAHVVGIVTEHNVDQLLYLVESVEPALIDSMKQLSPMEDNPDINDQEVILRKQYIDAYKKLCEYLNTQPFLVSNALQKGLDVGYPFEIYIRLLGDQLDDLEINPAADELLAMALISEDAKSHPREVIKQYLEQYFSDTEKITKINMRVNDILTVILS